MSQMMIEEYKLLEKFRDLNILASLQPHCLYASELRIVCDLKDQVTNTQGNDEFLKPLMNKIQVEQLEHLHIDEKGAMIYEGRLCVANSEELRNQILSETHYSKFPMHPDATKCAMISTNYFVEIE